MCGRNGTFQYITQHHVNTCNYVTIDCPNIECGLRFQRWRLNEHIDYECEYVKFSCKLCNTQVERRKLNEHKRGAVHVLHGKVARAVANVEELGRRVDFLLLLLMVTGVVCALLVVHTTRASDDGKISKMAALITEADKRIAQLKTESASVVHTMRASDDTKINKMAVLIKEVEKKIIQPETKSASVSLQYSHYRGGLATLFRDVTMVFLYACFILCFVSAAAVLGCLIKKIIANEMESV